MLIVSFEVQLVRRLNMKFNSRPPQDTVAGKLSSWWSQLRLDFLGRLSEESLSISCHLGLRDFSFIDWQNQSRFRDRKPILMM